MTSASAASASAGGVSVSTSAASAAAGGASSAASSAAAAGGGAAGGAASSASSSAATSVVVVNQNAAVPVVRTYRSNNNNLCWCCFGLLFITLIIAVTGVVLGLYAAYIATIIPILYGMNMCYQAKKEGRIKLSKLIKAMKFMVGGSSELPMWLTDGFLVTFFLKGGG